ncbi:SDR family NAD(P)-dependent oxidoreductase [Nocardioides humilatus]|uniref:SDR family NAD(P)-dependent oxidoreductase n=1 Tax=Nocardioides humilatus TaxID=2607660 RepID=A0A5B1L837_9ACTN|nr:oxidoreductase [Nocardioides humilatus]KAA1415930.1 SDR family NAD(P)-dependent oxidoreductase [Nocardioides humilatus]
MRPWTDVPPQQGRRFVITGGNGGIGFQAARILGSRGAEVVLACRSVEKGEAAARQVPGYDQGRVAVRRLDVADIASVRAFAADFLEDYDGLDVLVNNAGVLGAPLGFTVDGVETHFATNHLGHFALANLLLPAIRERVVVTSSREHRRGVLDLDDLAWERRPYKVFDAYAQSKLADLLFMTELQQRLTEAGSPVRAVGAHPGASSTNITSGSGNPVLTWIGVNGSKLVSMPAWRGALCTVYAATMDIPGDTYIGPHGRLELHGWPAVARRGKAAEDKVLGRRLWDVSEKLSGVSFPL